MKLTSDQVKKVAKLANLPLSSQEEEKYSEQLSQILDYVSELNQVNTDKVEPTFNSSPNIGEGGGDVVEESLTQEEAVSNASSKKDGFFVAKGVFKSE